MGPFVSIINGVCAALILRQGCPTPVAIYGGLVIFLLTFIAVGIFDVASSVRHRARRS